MSSKAVKHKRKSQELFRQAQFQSLYSFNSLDFKANITEKDDCINNRLFLWRRARDSNPRNRFNGLHDFQSCSFGHLGQLSTTLFIIQ